MAHRFENLQGQGRRVPRPLYLFLVHRVGFLLLGVLISQANLATLDVLRRGNRGSRGKDGQILCSSANAPQCYANALSVVRIAFACRLPIYWCLSPWKRFSTNALRQLKTIAEAGRGPASGLSSAPFRRWRKLALSCGHVQSHPPCQYPKSSSARSRPLARQRRWNRWW